MVGMGHVGIGGADGGCVSALGGAGLWWLGDRGIESCGISSSSGSTTATSPQSMDKISRNLFINGKIPKQLFQFPPNPNRSHKAGEIPCNNTKNPVPHPVATETSSVCISISSCDRRERCPATHRRTDWRFAETMQQARRAQKKMKKRGMPMRREMPRRRLAAGIVGGWGWW